MKKLLIIALLVVGCVFGTVINVPDEYATIQEGIDAAVNTDTVLVAQGAYYENLIIEKNITLTSNAIYDDLSEWAEFSVTFGQYELLNDNIDNTVINGSLDTNGEDVQSVIYINSPDECLEPVIFGFTITGGDGTATIEIIESENEDGEVEYVEVIRYRGGGFLAIDALPEFHYNYIYNNKGTDNSPIHSGGGTDIDLNERCEGDLDLSYNFYRDNDALYGNTLATNGYAGSLDMSNSIFDVYNCPDTTVTPVWVDIEEEVEVDFAYSDGDLCSITEDVWVSPDGDDYLNTGTSAGNAFLTIETALALIDPDSLNAITINLTEGIFSPSTTGESFPILMISNVNLIGQGEEVTIIDAEQTGRVITIENCENNTISDMTIKGGTTGEVIESGGGINIVDSELININNMIFENNTSHNGGAIKIEDAQLNLSSLNIHDNIGVWNGGGISIFDSFAILEDINIYNNSANVGGGLSLVLTDAILNNVNIHDNIGYYLSPGLFFQFSNPIFSSENRCNIYNNSYTVSTQDQSDDTENLVRNFGKDIYYDYHYHDCSLWFDQNNCIVSDIYGCTWDEETETCYNIAEELISIILDTFSVIMPTEYHVYPIDKFVFDIQNGIIPQVFDNVYVSPFGDDANSGIDIESPFKTITHAINAIVADSLNPHTIYLSNGVYSPSSNGENFPLHLSNYVSISGESREGVILDGEFSDIGYTLGGIINLNYILYSSLEKMTIINGISFRGGGIYMYNSNPILHNLLISNNYAGQFGGGLYMDQSDPMLSDVIIKLNSAGVNGGGVFLNSSNPTFTEDDRCNIYYNNSNSPSDSSRSIGSDLYSIPVDSIEFIYVPLDTFTVIEPTQYYAAPSDYYLFDIQYGMMELVSENLYISPQGDNSNSGLVPEFPLKTIRYALSIIQGDSINAPTIYLLNGIYSPSENGETFPLNIPSFITIIGESQNGVIIDAEQSGNVISTENVINTSIENLTIINGIGGGLSINNSEISLSNITVEGNQSNGFYAAGGIYISNSSPILNNINIIDNSSDGGSSGIYIINSNPQIYNTVMTNNIDLDDSNKGTLVLEDCSNFIIENIVIEDHNIFGRYLILFDESDGMINNMEVRNNYTSENADAVDLIMIDGSDLFFSKLKIISNQVIADVWANVIRIAIWDNNLTIKNALIAENQFTSQLISNFSNEGLSLINSTITKNITSSDCLMDEGGVWGDQFHIINSIIWENQTEGNYLCGNGDSFDETYAYFSNSDQPIGIGGECFSDDNSCDEYDENWCQWGISMGVCTEWISYGNINADPLFVDLENGDYTLLEGSPCINTGTVFLTFENEWDGIIDTLINLSGDDYIGLAPDMGAYEYYEELSAASVTPLSYQIQPAYPNPFNPVTNITYGLPESGIIELTVYNIQGRQVQTLVSTFQTAGYHSINWNASSYPSGVYFIKMIADNYISTQKLMLVK